MRDSFEQAMSALGQPSYAAGRYSAPFLEILPITGAAVSTLGDVLGSETISATDDLAAHLDELQFDLGEGPCWDALRLVQPVFEPSLKTAGPERWPAFAAAAHEASVASIFAFPLAVGTLRLGAVDLYSRAAVTLDSEQTRYATAMADVIGKRILERALAADGEEPFTVNPRSRRVIHQATGVVLAQLDLDPEDAQLLVQGHAFATSRTMMDVARDITEGRLRFVRHDGRIEAVE